MLALEFDGQTHCIGGNRKRRKKQKSPSFTGKLGLSGGLLIRLKTDETLVLAETEAALRVSNAIQKSPIFQIKSYS